MASKKSALKLSRWDSAEYLQTEADIFAYLDAAMAEAGDDPVFLAQVLGTIVRARNIMQLSRDTGISRAGLYKAFSADGNPSFATVVKVASALGFSVKFAPHNIP